MAKVNVAATVAVAGNLERFLTSTMPMVHVQYLPKVFSGLLFPDLVDCFCGLTSWRYMLRLMGRGSNRYNCSM